MKFISSQLIANLQSKVIEIVKYTE